MFLTKNQLAEFSDEGFLFLPALFSWDELEALQVELSKLVLSDFPGTVFENDNTTVRALHGCHMNSDLFYALSRHPRLSTPAQQILHGNIYVHQFKVNMKSAVHGEAWPWHQDFIYMNKEDGIPLPRAVSVVLYLDEVTEANGPLCLIPRSHLDGLIDTSVRSGHQESKRGSADWRVNFTTQLKYVLDVDALPCSGKDSRMVMPTGSAGSVLFFDVNLAHGSEPNTSTYDRRLAIIIYNSVENLPHLKERRRPSFLASHDYTPLQPITEDEWSVGLSKY